MSQITDLQDILKELTPFDCNILISPDNRIIQTVFKTPMGEKAFLCIAMEKSRQLKFENFSKWMQPKAASLKKEAKEYLLSEWLKDNSIVKKEITTKQAVIDHLESLGYKVSEKVFSNFTRLEARSDVKLNIAVNINNEDSIFITYLFGLAMPIEKVDQKFLEALNKTNTRFMFTKIIYKENDDKGSFSSCPIELYISTANLSYNKRDFALAISAMESSTKAYMEDLREFGELMI